MDHTTKTTTRLGTTAIAAIATVTLALLATAAIVVSVMMPTIVQTAYASCISSPKGDVACSGGSTPSITPTGASTFSHSNGQGDKFGNAASGPSGSLSQSFTHTFPPITHQSSSHNFEGAGNCAKNFPGPKVCSGH